MNIPNRESRRKSDTIEFDSRGVGVTYGGVAAVEVEEPSGEQWWGSDAEE